MELVVFRVLGGLLTLIMLGYYIRRRRRVLSALIGSLSGLAALWAVCRWGGMLGIFIRPDWFTVITSAVLGIPGVIFIIIVNLL